MGPHVEGLKGDHVMCVCKIRYHYTPYYVATEWFGMCERKFQPWLLITNVYIFTRTSPILLCQLIGCHFLACRTKPPLTHAIILSKIVYS